MITPETIEKEITELLATDIADLKKVQIKRIGNRIQFLRTVLAYLKSNPSEEFLKKETVRIRTRLEKINQGASCFIPPSNIKIEKAKAFYEKEYGVKSLKTQLATLRFICKN